MASRPKLILLFRCRNEAESLELALTAAPRALPGVGSIQQLVVVDGATSDHSAEVARRHADFVVRLSTPKSLARALQAGLVQAARAGADFVVTLPSETPFDLRDIESLLAPVIETRADMTIGEADAEGFAASLQQHLRGVAARASAHLSGVPFAKPPSALWALNRRALMRLATTSSLLSVGESTRISRGLGIRTTHVTVRLGRGPSSSTAMLRQTGFYLQRNATQTWTLALGYRSSRTLAMLAALIASAGAGLALGAGLGAVRSFTPGVVAVGLAALLAVCAAIAGLIEHYRRSARAGRVSLRSHDPAHRWSAHGHLHESGIG